MDRNSLLPSPGNHYRKLIYKMMLEDEPVLVQIPRCKGLSHLSSDEIWADLFADAVFHFENGGIAYSIKSWLRRTTSILATKKIVSYGRLGGAPLSIAHKNTACSEEGKMVVERILSDYQCFPNDLRPYILFMLENTGRKAISNILGVSEELVEQRLQEARRFVAKNYGLPGPLLP